MDAHGHPSSFLCEPNDAQVRSFTLGQVLGQGQIWTDFEQAKKRERAEVLDDAQLANTRCLYDPVAMMSAANRDYTLTRTQKNEVLRILQQARLDPSLFDWVAVPSSANWAAPQPVVSRLEYRSSSRFGFTFEFSPGEVHGAIYSPGLHSPRVSITTQDWAHQRGHVQMWAGCLKAEIEAPDLWAEIAQLPPAFLPAAPSAAGPNYWRESFTASEIQQLHERIDEFQRHVEEKLSALFAVGELNEEAHAGRLAYVREQIAEMKAEAPRQQSRQSWYYCALGLAMTVVASVPTDAHTALWHLFAGLVLSTLPLLHR